MAWVIFSLEFFESEKPYLLWLITCWQRNKPSYQAHPLQIYKCMCINIWQPEVGMAKNLLHTLHTDTLAPPVSNTCLRPCVVNVKSTKVLYKLGAMSVCFEM